LPDERRWSAFPDSRGYLLRLDGTRAGDPPAAVKNPGSGGLEGITVPIELEVSTASSSRPASPVETSAGALDRAELVRVAESLS
jgi:hypothetical protein